MKKMKLLNVVVLFAGLTLTSGGIFAQSKSKGEAKKNPIKVDNFQEGRTLTDSDLGFLNAVTADKKSKSRGAASDAVTIGSSTFKVGQTLTGDDATIIAKAISDSKNAKKEKNKDVSRGDCNLWCYYLLQDSYGRWYYYYYCCG